MDDTMDYVYHHAEYPPSQGQLPFSQQPSQQRSRCPYASREPHGHLANSPHRSTGHYDPVHASASHWQSQAQLPPHHWPPMLGPRATSTPYHRSSNSASEPPYYNAPGPNFGHALAGYQGPPVPHEIGGLQSIHPPFALNQLPPVRYGNPTPIQPNPPSANQTMFVPERAYGHPTGPLTNGHFGAPSPPMAPSTQPANAQESSESGVETPPPGAVPATSESTVSSNQAPPTSANIQFGSAPPSSTPQHNNPAFPLSSHRSHLLTAGGRDSTVASRLPLFSAPTHAQTGGSSSGPSSSSNNSAPAPHPPVERRRIPTNTRRTVSTRRQSPPSDREYDHDEMQLLERFIVQTGTRLMGGHDIDDNHIRAAQFLRGSVSTKMVASLSAIRSLQSVAIEDLSESERTCVICYNEFGVETPEGVKEAPLRLPRCKHVFGDHCIKKWFEESDSCPYCRDKVPSEPRMTSTNSAFNSIFRSRAHATLSNAMRDSNHGQDESSRTSATGPGHGERRSPPSDGGESRRRTRPRHGNFRGPGSPPFTSIRPGSFGGSSSTAHDNPRRSHAFSANRAYASNAPNRLNSGGPTPIPFSVGNISQYQIPSFGGPLDAASSTAASMPPYVPPMMPHGVPQGGPSAGFSTSLNRNSLPAPPPGNWHAGNPSMPDETHRRMMLGNSNAPLQANGPPQWGPQ